MSPFQILIRKRNALEDILDLTYSQELLLEIEKELKEVRDEIDRYTQENLVA